MTTRGSAVRQFHDRERVAGATGLGSGQPIRVYFLGSGEIGLPVLEVRASDPGICLTGIGSQPDRPSGRRRKLRPTPVSAWAAKRGVAADKPASVNREAFLERLREQTPDLVVVVSFGQILKAGLLDLPPHGCLNVHASLLPRHRGAAPVQAAIREGDSETGVSFMRMDEGLDTGPVYRRVRHPVRAGITAGDLEAELGALAAQHVGSCIVDVVRHGLQPDAQDDERATYARKMRKADGRIDWNAPADAIERQVRACLPWPRAFFFTERKGRPFRVQVLKADVSDCAAASVPAGTVVQADGDTWLVACGEQCLRLLRVVPEGKKEMAAAAFLRGHPVPPGTSLVETETLARD